MHGGGCLKWVYDPDPEKLRAFTRRFPQVKIARDEDEILQDTEVRMVAAADVPAKRCALGLRVMDSGKDYFTDKAPMTTLEQLEQAREKVKETGPDVRCLLQRARWHGERRLCGTID